MQFLKPLMNNHRNEDEKRLDVEIALREALSNAVVHGNHEDSQKHVDVNCRCTIDGEVLITVRDEGQGFDSRTLPDPTDNANLLLTHGRGLRFMQAFMDDVVFEDNGRTVHMRKWLWRSADVGAARGNGRVPQDLGRQTEGDRKLASDRSCTESHDS
jgi:serine/threonine-protein kinase RsbW